MIFLFSVRPEIDQAAFKDKRVTVGSNVFITCGLIRGDPPVIFKWTKDDIPAEDLHGTFVENRGVSSLLTIMVVDRMHDGSYSCTAANPVASSVITIRITVDGNHSLHDNVGCQTQD